MVLLKSFEIDFIILKKIHDRRFYKHSSLINGVLWFNNELLQVLNIPWL